MAQIFLKLKWLGNNFSVKLDDLKESAFNATESKNELWHKIFGHFNLKTLKFIYDSKMVNSLPQISTQFLICPSCATCKIHKKPFPTSTAFRVVTTLELVHLDICGPINTESLVENQYLCFFY